MQRIITIFMAVVLCVAVRANETAPTTDAHLSGHVVEAETGEHLPFYNIVIKGTPYATTTDASGHYIFRNLKPGQYTVEASMTGYATQQKKVRVDANSTTELNFEAAPDVFMLDQVVVTSTKGESTRRNSPTMVNVLNAKTLELVSAASLADGLTFQPGVRVENDCQNCGFTQVRINGLDGHYSQILVNSRPVFSALTGVYGLEQIPASMIDRVEVMRGGASALFGSSAIGGTVNIITKDPSVNTATVQHSLTSIGVSGALDNNTTANASVVTPNGQAGVFIYGQTRTRDGYDAGTDGFTEIAALRSNTIGARANMRTSDRSRLTMEYHNTTEWRRGGDSMDRPPHEAWIAEQTDHSIHAAEASFDLYNHQRTQHLALYGAMQSALRNSYYGSQKDPNAYGRTTDLVATGGVQYTHRLDRLWFMPAELMAGADYTFNRLHDVTLGYDHDVLQRVNTVSAFAQNEWRNDRWGFLLGARVDKNSLLRNPVVSPRANVRFNPTRGLNLRLTLSSGFRSPQAFDEDFHVAVVGGERVVTVLANGLKPENSRSVSASADWYTRIGLTQANFTLEGFYTDLSDVFALRQIGEDAAGNTVLERYNGSGARVYGITAEAKLAFPHHMQLQAGATVQRSRYKTPEVWSDNPNVAPARTLFRTPDVYGYMTFDYDVTRRLCLISTGTLTGPMTVQHIAGSGTPEDVAVRTPWFADLSLKAAYTVPLFADKVSMRIQGGITNIFNSWQRDFDNGPLRDSGYIYGPPAPRSLTASVSLTI